MLVRRSCGAEIAQGIGKMHQLAALAAQNLTGLRRSDFTRRHTGDAGDAANRDSNLPLIKHNDVI
jgi:hypothetical protein